MCGVFILSVEKKIIILKILRHIWIDRIRALSLQIFILRHIWIINYLGAGGGLR